MFVSSTKNRLSNSTIKQIKNQFDTDLSEFLGKDEVLESIKTPEKSQYILKNGLPIFIMADKFIPTLKCVHACPNIVKRVVVDVGAIKHIINGADVMAPGLLHQTSEFPSVSIGDIVAIYGYGKINAMAVGIILMDNQQVEEQRIGVAIKTVNHLGDRLYSYA
ncbi:malignant T-cell-amplified sequence [Nematocida homosporus]|uniref:malignant T-cell-amplified sequence n=1 Tax=Nematocida homosporus TaxID=1912981 RepID=UPI00221F4969|nr:malignant T-cell-amplified sequence [Nematocida homosporus]KAI5187434.1 malignant T-cell-amplified sequence [Nematocida homosporus]